MSGRASSGPRAGAAATAALALAVALGWVSCVDPTDPRTGFLQRWLEEHAPRLRDGARMALVGALLEAEIGTGTDAFLLLALIEEESRYDPRARSPKGARGLMQLRPATAEDVAARTGIPWPGPHALDDPVTNVRIGAAYVAELKQEFGGWTSTLSAYHSGPTRIRGIQRRGGKIPTRYASRVLRRHRTIHAAYEASGS